MNPLDSLDRNFSYPDYEPYFQKISANDQKEIKIFLNLLRTFALLGGDGPFYWTTTIINNKKRYMTRYQSYLFNLPFRIHLIVSKDIFPTPVFTPKDEDTLIDIKNYLDRNNNDYPVKTRKAFMNGSWVTVKQSINPKIEQIHALHTFNVEKVVDLNKIRITSKLVEPYREGSLKTFFEKNPNYLFNESQINAIFSQLLEYLCKFPAHNSYQDENIAYTNANGEFIVFPINFAFENKLSISSSEFLSPDHYCTKNYTLSNLFMHERNVWSMGLILLSILTRHNLAQKNLPYLCADETCQNHIPCFFINQLRSIEDVQAFLNEQQTKVLASFSNHFLQSLCKIVFTMLKADYRNRITPENALIEYFTLVRPQTKASSIFEQIARVNHLPTTILIPKLKLPNSKITFEGSIMPQEPA